MKKRYKSQKGITLVALVVTIIIVLILATISIQALTTTGLFKSAQEAKNVTEAKTEEENGILTEYLEQINAITGENIDGETVTPINDITTWLKTAGISNQYPYTTIEQIISNSNCIESLMNNENAMKYLARSTEFTNAICTNETAMIYLGQSEYRENTVLNNDIWKQKIKASQYWNLVYPTKTVIVYGAASETITIEGYYGSFTTDENGSCSQVVPIDTIILTGNVSGQSFTKTVTKDTKEIRVMPEGLILYWYGYENTDITGGIIACCNSINNPISFKKYTNYLEIPSINCGGGWISFAPKNNLNLSEYSKGYIESEWKITRTGISTYGLHLKYASDSNFSNSIEDIPFEITTNGSKKYREHDYNFSTPVYAQLGLYGTYTGEQTLYAWYYQK